MVNITDVREEILAQSRECAELLENKSKEVEEVQTDSKEINTNNDIINDSIESCRNEFSSEYNLDTTLSSPVL